MIWCAMQPEKATPPDYVFNCLYHPLLMSPHCQCDTLVAMVAWQLATGGLPTCQWWAANLPMVGWQPANGGLPLTPKTIFMRPPLCGPAAVKYVMSAKFHSHRCLLQKPQSDEYFSFLSGGFAPRTPFLGSGSFRDQ